MRNADNREDNSAKSPIVSDNIDFDPKNLLSEATASLTQDHATNGLFVSKPANTWMEEAKNRPVPAMLFDEFWYEGEVCILFGDTNQGKSALAVQIANSISRGESLTGFDLGARKQIVLYFDFELSDKQFELRYSEHMEGFTTNHYVFDSNFIRVEVSPEADIPECNYEDYVMQSINGQVLRNNAKVVIVDNLTWLIRDAEKAKEASKFMKSLQKLAKENKLSILVLAHTPKIDSSRPLSINHLQGSKMLSNFCSSVFVIGRSLRSPHIKYLKQLKVRNSGYKYTDENIVVIRLEKRDNFLGFEITHSTELNYNLESFHLLPISAEERQVRNREIIEKSGEGKSLREIATLYNMSHVNVKKIIDSSDADDFPF